MFASLALYHAPWIESTRPAAVEESWVNQAKALLDSGSPRSALPGQSLPDIFTVGESAEIDPADFQLVNATLRKSGEATVFGTNDKREGYALTAAERPLAKAVLSFSLKRAGKQGRHGNAFLVCAPSANIEGLIKCCLYYGGRSSLVITGKHVKDIEQKMDFDRRTAVHTMSVTVDCGARTLNFEADGKSVATDITGPVPAITHYGYGGGNSDSFVTAITVGQ